MIFAYGGRGFEFEFFLLKMWDSILKKKILLFIHRKIGSLEVDWGEENLNLKRKSMSFQSLYVPTK